MLNSFYITDNMKKNKILFALLICLFSCKLFAVTPVSWQFELVDKGNGEIELQCIAQIASGWHLYDTNIDEGGPFPTTLTIDELKGATAVGGVKTINSELRKEFDKVFGMEIGFYDLKATFVQRFKVTDKSIFLLKGDIRAQACNNEQCTAPLPIDFSFSASNLPASLNIPEEADLKPQKKDDTSIVEVKEAIILEPTTIVATEIDTIMQSPIVQLIDAVDLWAPVIDDLKTFGAEGDVSGKSLLIILGLGFLGGLIALITPCVWPMIPMTVSFFLKRNKKNRVKAIREAFIYGLSIVVIYASLGILVTVIFGAGALNDMATSAGLNLIFFALLIIFSASFFGAFDLVLPSSWTNKVDRKTDSTVEVISIFFMAFTLALVSFSCTGPLIGTLLVDAASSGSVVAPAMGMIGFAVALSIPFVFFAIFPSMLESIPKSGGWLNSVKVVLGFLELAFALKFLSMVDLAYGWGILDREVFLVLWIVIFALLGLYLLGKIKFAHESSINHISVIRLFLAIISLSFSLYMLPGLWGAPLKAISAFAPPLYTQDFNLYKDEVHAKFDDYETGMEYARKNKKPVIIDFSGFGCVNCRKMEASVWTDSRVKNILENDYVLITLMVDDKKKLPEIIEVEENGKKSKLKTIGDKWSYLQRHKFGTNSQPYYVTIDYNGKPIGPSYAYSENVNEYIVFLRKGLDNFKEK